MDKDIMKQILVSELDAYVQIIKQNGLDFIELNPDVIERASISDLRDLIHRASTIARTPLS